MAKKKKNWMAKAFGKNPGKLHRRLGVKQSEKIPASKLSRAAHSSDPSLRREAALAKVGKRFGGHRHGKRTARRKSSRR